jgi:hypothetical protein
MAKLKNFTGLSKIFPIVRAETLEEAKEIVRKKENEYNVTETVTKGIIQVGKIETIQGVKKKKVKKDE